MNALYQVVAMIGGGLLVGFALGANWMERRCRVTHVALEKTIRDFEKSTSRLADYCAVLEVKIPPRLLELYREELARSTQLGPSQSEEPA